MNSVSFIVVIVKILSLFKHFWNSFLKISLSVHVLEYTQYDESLTFRNEFDFENNLNRSSESKFRENDGKSVWELSLGIKNK